FRDAFNSIFFISVGMLVRVDFLVAHLPLLLLAALVILVAKSLIVAGVVLPFYPSLRVAIIIGLSLAALGELSFVLARFALPSGLLPEPHYQGFVAITVLTMLASPFLIRAAPTAATVLQGWTRRREPESVSQSPVGNVIIIGYGLNGENLA